MSDRLDELRRQRALLEQHLAWLDHEIAAAVAKQSESRVAPQQAISVPARSASTDRATTTAPTIATTVNVVQPSLASAVSAAPVPTLPVAPSPLDAEAVLDKYRFAPESLKQDLRKGCLFYFALAFALLIVGVAILYFALTKR